MNVRNLLSQKTALFYPAFCCVLICFLGSGYVQASSNAKANLLTETTESGELSEMHKKWLYNRFNDQHQKLIPVVAVADMFYGCNMERPSDKFKDVKLVDLIIETDRNELAEQLVSCLNGQAIQSGTALNYGIIGCFSQQLSSLERKERQEKMARVSQSLKTLSKAERQKSFTKCVTEQAIGYLK